MTDYRIRFNESELDSINVAPNILCLLRTTGEVRTVTEGVDCYWIPRCNPEALINFISAYKGVSVTCLQGNMLK